MEKGFNCLLKYFLIPSLRSAECALFSMLNTIKNKKNGQQNEIKQKGNSRVP